MSKIKKVVLTTPEEYIMRTDKVEKVSVSNDKSIFVLKPLGWHLENGIYLMDK